MVDKADKAAAWRTAGELRSAEVATRAEATRAALISAARVLFVDKGYFSTTIEDIVTSAGVGTRGALYHHFDDKQALFREVLTVVEDDMLATATTNLGDFGLLSALELLRSGVLSFLDAAMNPEVHRILLIDGPAVLGWQEWRTLEEGYGLGALRRLLRRAISEGALPDRPINALAHMIFAVIDEAALYIANAPDPQEARAETVAAVEQLLANLAVKSADV